MRNGCWYTGKRKKKTSTHGQLENDRRSFGIELLLSLCWTEGKKQWEEVFRAAASTQQQARLMPAMHYYVAGGIAIGPFRAVSHNSNNNNDNNNNNNISLQIEIGTGE